MGILIPGIISAFISWLYKPAGIVIALIGATPFLLTVIIGFFHLQADPSSSSQVINTIVISWTSWFTGEIQGYIGSAMFGAVIGIFIPKS
jgi:hypothetical protein